MSESIACIIPVYNNGRFIAEAINSVLAQTHPADEILVVDDGSTDDTAAVVERFGDRVRYYHREHMGVTAARDFGIEVSTCELLSFLDADDWFDPTKIEKQRRHLEQNPNVDLSVCLSQNFWDDEVPEDRRAGVPLEPAARYGQVQSWLIRKEAFDRHGRMTDELDKASASRWYLKAKDEGLVDAVLQEPLLHRRIHLNNSTRVDRTQHLDAIMEMLKHKKDKKEKSRAERSKKD